jgi:hypothetical protein
MPKKPGKYSLTFLEELVNASKTTIDYDKGLPEYLNRESDIPLICNCEEKIKFSKGFRHIEKTGAKCHSCTYDIALEKRKKTNEENYGVSYNSQRPEVVQKRKETSQINWGVPVPAQSPLVQQKAKETSLKKYGTAFPMQNIIVRQKVEETNLAERGVKCVFQDPIIKKQIAETNIENLGSANPFASTQIKEKIKETNMIKLGVHYPGQSEIIKEKIKETSKKNWGTDHPMQNSIVADKCLAKSTARKEYTMPSGDKRNVQGYEPFALNELLSEGYPEDKIITGTKNVKTIIWRDDEGKQHTHYPDIEIKDINHLIEVKSTYLYNRDRNKIIAKKDAAEKLGFIYEIRVYTKDGIRVNIDSDYNLIEILSSKNDSSSENSSNS